MTPLPARLAEYLTPVVERPLVSGYSNAFMERFYTELQKNPGNPYLACVAVTGGGPDALKLYEALSEVDFTNHRISIEQSGTESYLPSKADWLREIWDMFTGRGSIDAKLKAAKLYADARGYIVKQPDTVISNTVQSVMVVKDGGTDEEWAERTARRQKALLDDSAIDAKSERTS